jgi:hypothetical protein
MRDENEIKIAWEIWNFLNSLNDMIRDSYEDHFIEFCLKEEERKYWEKPPEENNGSDPDF